VIGPQEADSGGEETYKSRKKDLGQQERKLGGVHARRKKNKGFGGATDRKSTRKESKDGKRGPKKIGLLEERGRVPRANLENHVKKDRRKPPPTPFAR